MACRVSLRIRHNMRPIYCKNRNGATLQNVIFRTASPFPNARLLGLGRLPKPCRLALSLSGKFTVVCLF